jgi:hypothetical protein
MPHIGGRVLHLELRWETRRVVPPDPRTPGDGGGGPVVPLRGRV